MKKGEKGLKNASFWVMTPKIFAGGLPNPLPQTYSSEIALNRGKGLKHASF